MITIVYEKLISLEIFIKNGTIKFSAQLNFKNKIKIKKI